MSTLDDVTPWPTVSGRTEKESAGSRLGTLGRYISNGAAIHRDKVPKYLIFFVTSRCNATCDFCHYKYQIEDQERKKQEMTIDEIEKIAQKYGKISKLSISGGEPFVRQDLGDIIELFIRYCDPQIIDIPTNGSMPDRVERTIKQLLPILGDRVLDIQLSIDGPEEVHDRVRGIPGLFKKLLDCYSRISAIREDHPNIKIKMNMVYFSGNKDVTVEQAKFFEAGYDFDRFQITYPHGESVDDAIFENLDFKEFRDLSKSIQAHFKVRDRKDFHSLVFRAIKMVRDDILAENHALLNDMGAICKAGERILVLDERGKIYPCEPLWEDVGDLRDVDYDVHQILNGPKMAAFRDKYLGPGKCTCSWGCIALQKVIYTPTLYPKLLFNVAYLLFSGGKGFTKSIE